MFTSQLKVAGPSWRNVFLLSFVFHISTTCLAQSSSIDPSVARQSGASSTVSRRPSSTSSAPAQTHTVQVGLADHKFRPDVTEAAIGDTVLFEFYPTNHSVVRAEFGIPCIPYDMTGPNKQGFFSGFNAVDKVLENPPKYSLKINTTDPIFFYCSAPGSCITYAMVGAINPNTSTPIEKQRQLARDSAYMLNPGEPFPDESPLPSNIALRPSSTPPPPAASTEKKHPLSAGAIAGIVIGSISLILLAAFLLLFWRRSRRSSADKAAAAGQYGEKSTPGGNNMLQSPSGMYSPVPYHPHPHSHSNHTSLSFSPDLSYKHMSASPSGFHPAFSPQPQQQGSTYAYAAPGQENVIHEMHTEQEGVKVGQQQQQQQGGPDVRISTGGGVAAPPYGWHVNQVGPVEMEGGDGGKRV